AGAAAASMAPTAPRHCLRERVTVLIKLISCVGPRAHPRGRSTARIGHRPYVAGPRCLRGPAPSPESASIPSHGLRPCWLPSRILHLSPRRLDERNDVPWHWHVFQLFGELGTGVKGPVKEFEHLGRGQLPLLLLVDEHEGCPGNGPGLTARSVSKRC